MMKRLFLLPVVALLCMANSCDSNSQSGGEQKERNATKMNQDQSAVVVGMPAITNFTEKRQLKAIYEMRDNAKLVTYTYTLDMTGKRHTVCPTTSIGFGIPYATQYTTPERPYGEYQTGMIGLPQPEPNTLYMPSNAEATWVICLHPDGKTLAPTYVEPRIQVYLFEMPHVD